MVRARADDYDQLDVAIDDLVEIARGVPELDVVPGPGAIVHVHLPSGTGWPAKVIVVADVRESTVRDLALDEQHVHGNKLVVADRITEDARRALAELRWGWLDRTRGALFSRSLGPEATAFVPVMDRSFDLDGPDGIPARFLLDEGSTAIRGRAAISFAAALLHSPEEPPSLRSVARRVDMSAQSMSNASVRLAEHGMTGPDGRPLVPDLFWELAKVWRPEKLVPVAREPAAGMFSDAELNSGQGQGVALGGDLAAIALGARLVTADTRPWLWVPTHAQLRRLSRRLGTSRWEDRAAVLAVPPTPLVTLWRRPRDADQDWPTVDALFAALELATTPGRGREILDDFHPIGLGDEHRVWA